MIAKAFQGKGGWKKVGYVIQLPGSFRLRWLGFCTMEACLQIMLHTLPTLSYPPVPVVPAIPAFDHTNRGSCTTALLPLIACYLRWSRCPLQRITLGKHPWGRPLLTLGSVGLGPQLFP